MGPYSVNTTKITIASTNATTNATSTTTTTTTATTTTTTTTIVYDNCKVQRAVSLLKYVGSIQYS